MDEQYENIPVSKRENIFQAAVYEFSNHGFDQASTNRMTRQAKISKGLLFHYFKNKKQLYLATYDRGLQEIIDQMLGPISVSSLPTDLFERLLVFREIKHQYFVRNPSMYSFILST